MSKVAYIIWNYALKILIAKMLITPMEHILQISKTLQPYAEFKILIYQNIVVKCMHISKQIIRM